MRYLAVLLLLGGCATVPMQSDIAADSDRVVRYEARVQRLSAEQRGAITKYAALANAYRPGIADDLRAALADNRYAPYKAQLDIVHEFSIVQDKLSGDKRFYSQTPVIMLQDQIRGTEDALIVSRQEANFAATIYLQKIKGMSGERLKKSGLLSSQEVVWYSDHDGSESARSAVVFDDDGD